MGIGTSFGSLVDPASQTKVVAVTSQQGVAAGAGDNTELTSAAIDRLPKGLGGFLSALLCIGWKTSLTAAATLKLGVKISESDDGTTWGADEVLEVLATKTLSTGAQVNQDGVYELGLDLTKRKQYIRFKITMDLSAGATDVFVYSAVLVLFAPDKLPQ
jgi:hypothetical protein